MSRRNSTVLRTTDVLRLLGERAQHRMTLSDIAHRLRISKATAHSIVLTLADAGFLLRHGDRTYSLGREMVAIGQAALRRHQAFGVARREMEALAAETGIEGAISVTTNDEIIIVGRTDPNSVWMGMRTPLAPPFGGMFLAWSNKAAVERWLARAGVTGKSERTRLLRGLAAARRMGFHVAMPIDWLALKSALWMLEGGHDDRQISSVIQTVVGKLDQTEEYTLTRLAANTRIRPAHLSVPVINRSGDIELAVSLTGFREPLPAEEVRRLAERLRDSARKIADAIGGSVP